MALDGKGVNECRHRVAWFTRRSFAHALAKIGDPAEMDDRLGRELYQRSLYAAQIRVVPGQDALRVFRTDVFGRANGQLIRWWIYFVLRRDDVVELQNIEGVEEDMTGVMPGL